MLYRALSAAQAAYEKGERRGDALRQIMTDIITAEPLARLQYVSCTNYDTLEEADQIIGKVLLSMAVFIGKTRLIDNFILG